MKVLYENKLEKYTTNHTCIFHVHLQIHSAWLFCNQFIYLFDLKNFYYLIYSLFKILRFVDLFGHSTHNISWLFLWHCFCCNGKKSYIATLGGENHNG